MSSVNGFVGAWGIAGYVSSNFVLRGLTRVASIELGAQGGAGELHPPGPIDTDMLRTGLPEGVDVLDAMASAVPAGRVGTVEEVAAMVAFLVSDEASFCHGGEFALDGGFLAGPAGYPGR